MNRKLREFLWDLCGFTGTGCAVVGAWLAYKPAGWILLGSAMFYFAVIGSKGE